jgi:hypothetical protein
MERERGRATYTEVEESDTDLKRFRSWLEAVRERDYFDAGGRTEAEDAFDACERALAEFEAEAFAGELAATGQEASRAGTEWHAGSRSASAWRCSSTPGSSRGSFFDWPPRRGAVVGPVHPRLPRPVPALDERPARAAYGQAADRRAPRLPRDAVRPDPGLHPYRWSAGRRDRRRSGAPIGPPRGRQDPGPRAPAGAGHKRCARSCASRARQTDRLPWTSRSQPESPHAARWVASGRTRQPADSRQPRTTSESAGSSKPLHVRLPAQMYPLLLSHRSEK